MPVNKSEQAINSGDPNFAAALMTVGCPPYDPPVKLVSTHSGHDYVTFQIRDTAIDGTPTMAFSVAWSNPNYMADFEAQGHGFAKVAAFSASKDRRTGPSIDAWICHMADYCGITIDAAAKAVKNVREVCSASPESLVAYCAAFISNRFAILSAAKEAQRAGDIDVFMAHGSGFSIISEKLPEKQRQYLLKR